MPKTLKAPRKFNKRSDLPRRTCECGCSEEFQPDRITQRFLPGHRFAAYQQHECPLCTLSHRIKGQ